MKQNLERSEWSNYFEDFNRRNQARLTRLEVFGENGAQQEEHGLPFAGISFDGGSGAPRIEIMLGEQHAREARRLTHTIANVQEITPKRAQDGRDEALQIVSEHGETCLLRFEPQTMIAD